MLLLFSSQYKGQSPRSNIDCLVLVSRDFKQLGRERQRRRLLIFFLLSVFRFLVCITRTVSFSFCLKMCEYENLEALFLKLHKD